jgi:hypothetical protein
MAIDFYQLRYLLMETININFSKETNNLLFVSLLSAHFFIWIKVTFLFHSTFSLNQTPLFSVIIDFVSIFLHKVSLPVNS